MRFAEQNPVKGLVLVSACVTDLGIENERLSGYYNRSVPLPCGAVPCDVLELEGLGSFGLREGFVCVRACCTPRRGGECSWWWW